MAKLRQLLIGLASSSALYSGLTPALGLGDITLHSALSQPLDAEIELLDVGDLGVDEMRIRLAPADVFSRSGVERLYFFNDLRFTPILRPGKNVIRVVSNQPVREPYLNFIVEVVRPNGQLYREYTVLLDPPSSAAYRSLAATPISAPVSAAPASRSNPARVSAPAVLPAAQLGERYSVVQGDSLWKITSRLASTAQVSQQALMADIHALNPQAFINGDISRLRADTQLLLPDSVARAALVAQTGSAAAQANAASVSENTPAVSAPLPLDPAAELLIQEQTRLEQELAGQITETLQLQQSIAELGLQVQELQAQMQTRDQQIAGLQAELAARQANAQVSPAPAAVTDTPAVSAESGVSWLAVIAGLLALLFAGVVGLFWRGRKPRAPVSAALEPARAPVNVQSSEPVAAPLPQVALNVREAPRARQAWPAAGEDALQSANVYIAYGSLNEAASVLRKALQAQPQRSDIGFRLLEVQAMAGDVQGFAAQEDVLRAAGFTPARIDELKVRYAELFSTPPASLLDDVELQLDEPEPEPLRPNDAANDGQLNLDDLSLDADWDLVSPFAPVAKNKSADKAGGSAAGKSSEAGVFELPGGRDARSPFAESMLVEETPADDWSAEDFNVELLDDAEGTDNLLLGDLDHLADSSDNLTKLNVALAYIEQGSLDSACQILNEVINEGDEEQKQEARQLLAKIA